jgi:exonuclease VII small subunit
MGAGDIWKVGEEIVRRLEAGNWKLDAGNRKLEIGK